MTEKGFEGCLQALLDGEIPGAESAVNEVFDPERIREVVTFAEADVLTHNRGLVVRMDDGTEFQITIVRSR